MDGKTQGTVIQVLLNEVDRLKAELAATKASAVTKVKLPGRLGDPGMCLGTDPRADPRMVACLKKAGFDQNVPDAPGIGTDSSKEVLQAFMIEAEKGYDGFLSQVTGVANLPPYDVLQSEETIKGKDGNDIKLFISKPKDTTAANKLPCLVHFHGGGYAILKGVLYVLMLLTI